MKRFLCFCVIGIFLASIIHAAEPLRVFIRGGKKSHGPGAHEHEQFLKDWTNLLNQRGMKASGAMDFPTDAQLAQTDLLLMYAQDGGTVPPERRAALDEFLKRGGGLVVIHTATVPKDSAHWKSIIGGSWVNGTTKWLEGPMSLYYLDGDHPITREASNFDMDDEIYYDMDISPEVHVLAGAYTPKTTGGPRRAASAGGNRASVFDIQPQMWTYERTIAGGQPYRAFVSIPGHLYTNFARPNYRAVLLRGIAWAAKRSDVNEFCHRDELASLRYPEGGPTAPEKAAAKLEVHPDFNINLVAAEPLINKPININWDPQGRLWVAETVEYPNGRRFPNVEPWKDSGSLVRSGSITNRPARDRISILTDTNGDGRADKKDVFYEGLELVTSFVFHRDGVIACSAPDIWLIRDTDGDGRAETVSKLYTGLGIGDTHAVINNLRWGFDGWIYATHGYSASDHVRNGDGSKDFGRIGSGVVRFRPDGSAFEQYCSKGGNTWGLDISWDNEVFFTQPTSGDLLNHVVLPESILARGQVPGTRSYKPQIVRRKSVPLLSYDKLPYVQIDLVGSFTASAGCAIYDGGAWPSEWNYSYFTTEPTINIVHHEVVKPDGVSFTANKVREPEFIGGRDMWFRPIETRIGPDGAIYICDFYNQAVVHNDTRGPKHGPANAAVRPDRDHYFGRIWRVQHKEARPAQIPNLAKASPTELVKALAHPNIHVRENAQRLITEKGAELGADQFAKTFALADRNLESNPRWNIHWQWILHNLNLDQRRDPPARLRENPEVLKNSLRLAMAAVAPTRSTERPATLTTSGKDATLLIEAASNSNARVSLDAIVALNSFAGDKNVAAALLNIYPSLDDVWRQSAVIGVAALAPDRFIAEALGSRTAESLTNFVATLTAQIASQGNTNAVVSMVNALAQGPTSPGASKQVCLETLARTLNARFAPEWSAELQNALRSLVSSPSPNVRAATLPLIARWDKSGALSGDIRGLVADLMSKIDNANLSDDERAQVVSNLIGLRQTNPEILPAIAKLLAPGTALALQRRVIETLGQSGDAAAGPILASAYAQADTDTRSRLLTQLLKRGDWSAAFLDLVEGGKINAGEISPADFYRLRTHRDVKVASRASDLWTKARGETGLEKNALIAKFTPTVTQPGDVKKGQELFTANCATCHKLGNLGTEVGPVLTGMGAHGPAELLVHILDPNREVDPSFVSVNVETKDGESYDGIIARENSAMLALRNASGEKEIPVGQIKSRQSTGRSLMPEGFESLGGEGLRDLLAFVCASESRFRFIDLTPAFTADSRSGHYLNPEAASDTINFKKFGPVTVAGIPFNIVDPAKTQSGRNIVVLKGGASGSFSRRLPQGVSAKVGFPVAKLHFLGGIGGWAYPGGGDGTPVLKVTLQYADGQTEALTMKNGDEFADHIRVVDVPGSTLAEGVVTDHQMRWFSKPLKHSGVVERLEMESFNNGVAPTTVAITAELPDADSPSPNKGEQLRASSPSPLNGERAGVRGENVATMADKSKPFEWGKGTRVLLVGGGTSHDFNRWFNIADSALLKQNDACSVNYTEDPEVAARELPHAQVAIFSVNKTGFPTEALRKAFTDFVDAGKGLVLLHPGLWYNWNDWPEYNRVFAGGGSRGHDSLGEFEVKVTEPNHPLTKGLPSTFKITDELYWFQPDPKGTPIEVLATAHSPKKNADFPMIFTVKHPKTRIVGITLGHDARAHNLPEFQRLLKNAVNWCAEGR